MGFYGNITNTTKTGFTFDKTYPNRYEMEYNMTNDGIYIGRFVLVDYDQDSENIRRVYYPIDDLQNLDNDTYTTLYSDPSCVNRVAFNSGGIVIDDNNLVTGINKDDICYVLNGTNKKEFFKCVGEYIYEDAEGILINTGLALFIRFAEGPEHEGIYRWNYAVNYEVDQLNYGEKYETSIGRGWDSTVWQKVYENGKEKYVMIAELNSVVPTFTLSADAPTTNPIVPHFDEVSNNIYYELHWQPQWGMRIKHAKGIMSADGEWMVDSNDNLLSDETTTWIQSIYNKELKLHQYYYYGADAKWHLVDIPRDPNYTYDYFEPIEFADVVDYVKTKDDSQLPAAIYYNKAGFNPAVHFSSSANDKVQMTPTGYSQQPVKFDYVIYETEEGANGGVEATEWIPTEYNDHERGIMSKQVDTQEWQMILPSLGNAVSSMWDIVYGVGVDNKGNPVYQYDEEGNIKLDSAKRPLGAIDNDYNRLTYIDWVDGSDPNDAQRLRLVQETENGFTYETNQVETLAGCINSVHDLMGMIVVDSSDIEIGDNDDYNRLVAQSDEDKIYYLSDGGYYRRGIGYNYIDLDYTYELISVTEDEYQPNFYYYLNKEDGSFYRERYNEIRVDYLNSKTQIEIQFRDDEQSLKLQLENLEKSFKLGVDQLNAEYFPKLMADLSGEFDATKVYFVKQLLNPDDEYKTIELDQYEKGKYYYASGDNYLVENNPVARNVTYYIFNGIENLKEEDKITDDFIQTKYYEKRVTDNAYQPASTSIPEMDIYYSIPTVVTPSVTHKLSIPSLYDFENETYQGKVLTYFWTPGAFATKTMVDGKASYQFTEMNSTYDPTKQYYLLEWRKITKYNPDTGEVTYEPEILLNENGKEKAYKVNLIPLEDEKYYKLETVQGTYNQYIYIPATQEMIAKEYEEFGRARLDNTNYSDNYVVDFNKSNVYYRLNELTTYPKEMFYVTNKFYYLDENMNLLKDKNLKFTKDRVYYSLLDNTFTQIENTFYKPNAYYYKDGLYYVLDKEFSKQGTQYYEKIYFYVKSDLEGLYAMGSQWNRGIEGIPCTVELAKREKTYEMKLLNGFARTFNTIHGLIININKILLSGDYHTRDRNTVQGCINLMNDIINRFQEDFEPRQLIVSDNYGRMQSVPIETNKWIDTDIIGKSNDGIFRIEHMYPEKKNNTTDTIDKNGNGDTIELEKVVIDETGHIKNTHTDTVTLPYGYKTFIDNNGSQAVAENTQDTFTFKDDTWVTATISDKSLQIQHEYPNEPQAEYGQEEDKSPKFGQTFNTVFFDVDERGHVAHAHTTEITLPKGSLSSDYTNNNPARVLTGIGFTASSGKISYSQDNVGNLILTGYSTGSNANEVVASDTINDAFSKLQRHILNTDNTLNQEINNLTQTIGRVEQNLTNNINGVNTNLGNRIDSLSTNIGNVNTNLSDRINNLSNKVDNNNTTVTNNINSINDTLNIINGDVNTTGSIKQQIAALSISDYLKTTDLENQVKAIEFNYTEEIKTLQAIINDLSNRLNALENPITE